MRDAHADEALEVAMLKLTVGDEVVLTSGEDAGSIGEVLAVNYGACLGPVAQVKWHHGTTSWLAVDLLDELVDESARGLIDDSKASGTIVHARYSRPLESALLGREFECHAAGLRNAGRSLELLGDDWTVILHNGVAL
jgi:hypothetical protein